MAIAVKKGEKEGTYEGFDREDDTKVYTASECDMCFGSNMELRALAEHYACDDALPEFVADFCRTWTKVMNLDRYDVFG